MGSIDVPPRSDLSISTQLGGELKHSTSDSFNASLRYFSQPVATSTTLPTGPERAKSLQRRRPVPQLEELEAGQSLAPLASTTFAAHRRSVSSPVELEGKVLGVAARKVLLRRSAEKVGEAGAAGSGWKDGSRSQGGFPKLGKEVFDGGRAQPAQVLPVSRELPVVQEELPSTPHPNPVITPPVSQLHPPLPLPLSVATPPADDIPKALPAPRSSIIEMELAYDRMRRMLAAEGRDPVFEGVGTRVTRHVGMRSVSFEASRRDRSWLTSPAPSTSTPLDPPRRVTGVWLPTPEPSDDSTDSTSYSQLSHNDLRAPSSPTTTLGTSKRSSADPIRVELVGRAGGAPAIERRGARARATTAEGLSPAPASPSFSPTPLPLPHFELEPPTPIVVPSEDEHFTMSSIRKMDRLELFFLCARLSSRLSQTRLERDAVLEELGESRRSGTVWEGRAREAMSGFEACRRENETLSQRKEHAESGQVKSSKESPMSETCWFIGDEVPSPTIPSRKKSISSPRLSTPNHAALSCTSPPWTHARHEWDVSIDSTPDRLCFVDRLPKPEQSHALRNGPRVDMGARNASLGPMPNLATRSFRGGASATPVRTVSKGSSRSSTSGCGSPSPAEYDYATQRPSEHWGGSLATVQFTAAEQFILLDLAEPGSELDD